MIRRLLMSLIFLVGTHSYGASSDLKKLSDSIFKIATYERLGPGVATAFAVEYKGKKYMVTNNHVCDSFYKSKRIVLIKSGTHSEVPRTAPEFVNTDPVTQYYMHYGADICIFQSRDMDNYRGLNLASESAEPTDDILISGFVGRSLDLMYIQGKVYGSTNIKHPAELKSCLLEPPAPKTSSDITCTFFTEYPSYIVKKLQTASNNIGPGFSGSPVLMDGKVVGIVSRYYVPASGYSNGDVIFFPVADIISAIEASNEGMVLVNSKDFVHWIKVFHFDEGVDSALQQMQLDLQDTIRDLRREYEDE